MKGFQPLVKVLTLSNIFSSNICKIGLVLDESENRTEGHV